MGLSVIYTLHIHPSTAPAKASRLINMGAESSPFNINKRQTADIKQSQNKWAASLGVIVGKNNGSSKRTRTAAVLLCTSQLAGSSF